MFGTIGNEYLYAAYRITATFKARDESEFEKSGTAFGVQNSKGQFCFVTNRHILDAGYNDKAGKYIGCELVAMRVAAFKAKDEKTELKPTERIVFDLLWEPKAVRFATDYFEDVACIVQPKVASVDGSEVTLAFFLKFDELADDAWIEGKLSICDAVAFPGFPPWHDRLENRPILRTGTIASDPRANYSDATTPKGRRVAYEAFSFGGSSGSPIVALQKGFKPGPGIQLSGYREAKIVGINAGHLTGEYGAHSGVSYFIKSSVILELIERAS